MKKITLLLIFAILVLSTSAFAASVSRDMASRVGPGDDIKVTFSISTTAGELFTLEDQAPQGWRVDAWDVSGAVGGKEAVDYRFVPEDNRHGFSFTAESANPTISFTVKVPTTAANGDYNFDAVYFDSAGQNRNQATVTVRTITCGDGVCEGGENTASCAQDCPAAPPPPAEQPEAPAEEGAEEAAGTTGIIILVLIVIVLLVAFFIYTKRKKPPVVEKRF